MEDMKQGFFHHNTALHLTLDKSVAFVATALFCRKSAHFEEWRVFEFFKITKIKRQNFLQSGCPECR